MEPPTTFNDWLRAHRALLDAEKRLAELAERYARGEVSKQKLDTAHELVVGQRELVEVVFQKSIHPTAGSEPLG
jgi:hypothetical protein